MLSNRKWYLLIFSILIGVLGIFPFYLPSGKQAIADIEIDLTNQATAKGEDERSSSTNQEFSDLPIIQQTTLLPLISPSSQAEIETLEKFEVIVTAYSSSVWENDGDPFITASGTRVKDGIVANNFLPFGSQIRLPEIFGDKIFVVEDRMHSRKSDYQIDIWFPSNQEALNFGVKLTEMEIVKLP
jgi:3D (Asp-Asp-Asp) domain-containing protein